MMPWLRSAEQAATPDAGRQLSSATDLLKSTVLMGYLNSNRATMTYLLTMRVSALGNCLPQTAYRGALIDLVDHMQRATNETVGLSCAAVFRNGPMRSMLSAWTYERHR